MLKNYIKIAIRNIWKRKGYSAINIFGLSIGVAATIILSLYAYNELSYDRFNEHAEDIYMVYKERVTPSGVQDSFDTWVPLKEELGNSFPSVVNATRQYNDRVWIETEQEKFQETVTYTDASLFEIFSFSLAEGNNQNPFPDLHSIIISKEMAEKYFGAERALGKTLRLNFDQEYVVSGVLDEIPDNSSIQMEMAIQIESDPTYSDFEQNWGTSFLMTYIQLQEDASREELESKFPAFVTTIWDQETSERTNFKLLPLLEVNNSRNNSFRYAYIHLGIALVIILIACINFMNMATARSMERIREVGMRKALGAGRAQLIRQFLGEAFVLCAISVAAGILVAELALPYFNNLYDVSLGLNLLGNPLVVSGLVVLTLLLSLCAGAYPAFYLSRFSSIESLRGRYSSKPGGSSLRHGLITTQFAVTVALIIGTLVVMNQIDYMKSADLGFQKENTIAIQVARSDFDDPEQAALRLETFKQEIRQFSNVISVSSSEDIPGNWSNSFTFAVPEGWTNENPMRVRYSFMDHNFFNTYGIELLEGRNFREGSETDQRENVIVNKSALRDFGWETGVGKVVGLGSSGNTGLQVIGVVEDYNFQSLENEVAPILHVYRQPDNGAHQFVSVKINNANLSSTLRFIEEQWDLLDSSREMNYFFVDENFNRQYQRQEQLASIAGSFSTLAIVVACLGLLALVSLTVQQRKKEIGVRKVLGATTGRILLIISKDYLKLVVIGYLLAIPVAWYMMNQWLANYAYHIDLGIGIFLLAGVITILASLIIVLFEATKAAYSNPVDSLRSE